MVNLKKYCVETLKYMLRSGLVIRPYVKELERLYDMNPRELKAWKERRFIEIFRKAYTRSPFYHKFYSDAGIGIDDIKCIDDIKKLPILTKEMVKTHGEEMLTEPKWKLVGNHTSGTTGTPLAVWESWPALWREQACFHSSRRRWGYRYCQPIVSLRGNLDKDETHLLVHISNTLYLSSYNINEHTSKLYYDLIKRHKPVAIEGYPSTLYNLALIFRDFGYKLEIPVAFTSSETLLPHQRELIQSQFGSELFDHFGTTERSIRLCERSDHQGYYEVPGYSINEYDDEGETTTSLINDAFPLIRYRGNDLLEFTQADDDASGVRITSIKGRKSCALKGKDGSAYSSALLTRVFKDIVTIDMAQFVQHHPGEVSLNIVKGPGFSEQDMEKLKNAVKEQLGEDNFDIKFSCITPDEIIYSSRGKFSYVVTDC